MPMSEFETERQQLIDRAEAAERERDDLQVKCTEAFDDAVRSEHTRLGKEASIRGLIEKWRKRAEPNFADPEATEETLAYWSGAKRCANELEALFPSQEEK